MGFFSRPLINLPIINPNQETLQVFARNCNNNDVQPLHEIEELLIDLKVVDESYIVEVHIQNLWKQGLAWKLHNYKFLRIILAPKVGVQVMPKGGVLGLERFYEKSYVYIGGKNNGNICASNIGFMITSHLHFLFMDIEGGS